MAQSDVHRNASKKSAADFAYLMELQSNLFEDSTRVVVVPLLPVSKIANKDPTLNPEFDIEASSVLLFPLDRALNQTAICKNDLQVQCTRLKDARAIQFGHDAPDHVNSHKSGRSERPLPTVQ